jgi:hypothetical protein
MKEKMKLVEEHMMSSYKQEMIRSDMVKEVIIHDSYERYLFKPSEVEVKWLIAKLRFNIADLELTEEIKRQDDESFMNWIYGK